MKNITPLRDNPDHTNSRIDEARVERPNREVDHGGHLSGRRQL